MNSEFILEVLGFVHYILNTKLPYKWDFCRLPLKTGIRLYINTVSYFIAYGAFGFWFTKYILREHREAAEGRISRRQWCLAVILSLSTATQVLWPVFLVLCYFMIGSFYPWFSSTIALSLNILSPISSMTALGILRIKAYIQTKLLRRQDSSVQSESRRVSLDYSTFSASEELISNAEQRNQASHENEILANTSPTIVPSVVEKRRLKVAAKKTRSLPNTFVGTQEKTHLDTEDIKSKTADILPETKELLENEGLGSRNVKGNENSQIEENNS